MPDGGVIWKSKGISFCTLDKSMLSTALHTSKPTSSAVALAYSVAFIDAHLTYRCRVAVSGVSLIGSGSASISYAL